MENNYCVIMSGGIGSRFWPASRSTYPKQFLDFFGTGQSLLQHTYHRFSKIIPPENIFVVSNKLYGKLIREQLPGLSPKQILLEPQRRNTAIQIRANAALEKIQVYDLTGRLRLHLEQIQSNECRVDATGLSPGIYILRAKSVSGKEATIKLLRH
jgi:hypothetical protein